MWQSSVMRFASRQMHGASLTTPMFEGYFHTSDLNSKSSQPLHPLDLHAALAIVKQRSWINSTYQWASHGPLGADLVDKATCTRSQPQAF